MSVSKSLKPILIGVIVIVVLALLLVAFMVIFPEKEDEIARALEYIRMQPDITVEEVQNYHD